MPQPTRLRDYLRAAIRDWLLEDFVEDMRNDTRAEIDDALADYDDMTAARPGHDERAERAEQADRAARDINRRAVHPPVTPARHFRLHGVSPVLRRLHRFVEVEPHDDIDEPRDADQGAFTPDREEIDAALDLRLVDDILAFLLVRPETGKATVARPVLEALLRNLIPPLEAGGWLNDGVEVEVVDDDGRQLWRVTPAYQRRSEILGQQVIDLLRATPQGAHYDFTTPYDVLPSIFAELAINGMGVSSHVAGAYGALAEQHRARRAVAKHAGSVDTARTIVQALRAGTATRPDVEPVAAPMWNVANAEPLPAPSPLAPTPKLGDPSAGLQADGPGRRGGKRTGVPGTLHDGDIDV
jgi:hypothetical protein